MADSYRKMARYRDRHPERALEVIAPAIGRLSALPPHCQTETTRAVVARGMADQAALLVRIGRRPEGLDVYREVVRQYAEDDSIPVSGVVAECRAVLDTVGAVPARSTGEP